MHTYWWLLAIPLFIGFFVGLWCLVIKFLSLMGWQQLAGHYKVAAVAPGPTYSLGQAYIRSVKYNGVLDASVSEQGLGLSAMALFRIGHPPLLVPWSAFGPFRGEKFLWTTTYTTYISTGSSGSVKLSFTNLDLLAAMRTWIVVEDMV